MASVPQPEDKATGPGSSPTSSRFDMPSDPRMYGLVQLAADMHEVPIAAVTVISDGQQWFTSIHGLSIPEPMRAPAFSPPILEPAGVLVVEDASRDARFSENPLVTGAPHIRFYAGATLRGSAGKPLGTLHLVDRQPRTLDEAGRHRLTTLATGIAALLELHNAEASLQQASTIDPVTGLHNRAVFDEWLDRAVAAATREKPLALLLIDLDRFKMINDRYGAPTGDTLLALSARRLRGALMNGAASKQGAASKLGAGPKQGGVLQRDGLVARFGGDEFAVLVPDLVDEAEALAIARRLASVLSEPTEAPAGSQDAWHDFPSITASIGLAVCPRDAADHGSLTRAAGAALYRAKRAGGSCIVRARGVALRTLRGRTSVGRELEQDLLTALGANQTQLWWQPYISLENDEVVGLEALLRWDRPGYGNVPPATLLPLVEANGLTVPLDEWVLHRACHMAAAWPVPRTASVNLSAHWFGQDDVEALVGRALDASGLDPMRLCLELTEHTLIANREFAQDRMRRLHGLGAKLALDDFGTGSSSLAYLQHFRFDTIKMDRAFVAPLGQDTRAETVARTVLRMGHDLGATMCAEGVETAEQLAFLRAEHCDLVQGYLLGRPAPAALMDRRPVQ